MGQEDYGSVNDLLDWYQANRKQILESLSEKPEALEHVTEAD